MSNPFYVEPLGGLNIGQAVYDTGSKIMADREAARQQEAQQVVLSQAQQLFQNNDIDELGALMISNPELAKRVQSAMGFRSDNTRKNAAQSAFGFLIGERSAEEVAASRAEMVAAEGGDPTDTILWSKASPEEQRALAEMVLMSSDPALHERYKDQYKGGEGFTLSEGQARFDAEGNLVAERAKTVNELDKELKQGKSRFDQASKLRGEVERVSKVYRDIEDAFGRVKAATEGSPSGAGDMALIFNYMKMLDPGSTVREGEFATAAQTGGIPAYLVNSYNKAVDGQMLTPKQRKQFVGQAKKQFDTATKRHAKRLKDYENLGSRYGLERGEVIVSEPDELAGDTVSSAPMEGAKKAPDGKWYIQKDGQYFRVD